MLDRNFFSGLVAIAIAAVFINCGNAPDKPEKQGEQGEQAVAQISITQQTPDDYVPHDYREVIPGPDSVLFLTDKTRVLLSENSKVQYRSGNKNKQILEVDGDVFFEMNQIKPPYYIYTKLMKLTIMEPSAFRVSAWKKDEGEEVQVLWGKVKAEKTYKSPYPDPDTMVAKQLFMINRTIDLTEKEKLDIEILQNWYDSALIKFPVQAQ